MNKQKLQVSNLFQQFDSNDDGKLTREEFVKGLEASGIYTCVEIL